MRKLLEDAKKENARLLEAMAKGGGGGGDGPASSAAKDAGEAKAEDGKDEVDGKAGDKARAKSGATGATGATGDAGATEGTDKADKADKAVKFAGEEGAKGTPATGEDGEDEDTGDDEDDEDDDSEEAGEVLSAEERLRKCQLELIQAHQDKRKALALVVQLVGRKKLLRHLVRLYDPASHLLPPCLVSLFKSDAHLSTCPLLIHSLIYIHHSHTYVYTNGPPHCLSLLSHNTTYAGRYARCQSWG